MLELESFSPLRIPLKVRAQARAEGKKLTFDFEWDDPEKLVLDATNAGEWRSWERADDLWKTTCFEAFVGRQGNKGYWEFNFSPSKRRWNLYRFNAYRDPQPPRASEDFELVEVEGAEGRLKCVLQARFELAKLECSLTAVIRTDHGINYFALTHAGKKADFHERDSFTLKI